MKTLFIRVDMNNVIATGHLMRCLSVAEAGRTIGIESVFILADNEAVPLLESKEYRYIVLHTKWDDLDSEIDLLREVIQKEHVEKLLIDTYQVTENYLRALTALTYTIYLDDLNAFIYPVNAIICYANYWKKFSYLNTYEEARNDGIIEFLPQFYLGCEYAPLRQEFRFLPDKNISGKISRVLVMSGGADPNDSLTYILNEMKLDEFEHIDVICGRFYQKIDELKRKYEEYPNIHIHSNVNNLVDYMRSADLAISAGGFTLYELCAVGTPTISFSFANNQLDNVRQFEEDKIMEYLGDFRRCDTIKPISDVIERYKDKEYRRMRAVLMQRLVDGNGATRIIKSVEKNIEFSYGRK